MGGGTLQSATSLARNDTPAARVIGTYARNPAANAGRIHDEMTIWTTLLGPLRTRWRRSTAIAERPTAVVERERAPRVPAEYLSLYSYLEHRYASSVVLTFEQMEALLGFALPAPACTEPDWWTAAAVPAHRHSAAWTGAGRTATPNLPARTVRFERPA